MPPRPRLSLCIPTWNRSRYLQGALESGLREAASQPAGTIEVLVCDNASGDETPNVISRIQAVHPELRSFRNTENLGFDRNYLRCVEEARGEFVWIMGDDDEWRPGSIGRVLRELDGGADVCLCLAETCDMDLNPTGIHPFLLDPNPKPVWHLENREDRIAYFNACARNAGVFGYISAVVFPRDRFLSHLDSLQRAIGTGYIHLWGMMETLCQPIHLHYIPEALVLNRINDEGITGGGKNIFHWWMLDLRAWATIADAVFGDDPGCHAAFSRIVGRNHHHNLPGIRWSAPSETCWQQAVPYLIRAGFTPVRLAALDFAYQHMYGNRLAMPTLNPASLCLVDLPILARGAQRIAVMALGGRESLLDSLSVLAALRTAAQTIDVLFFCTPDCAELLDGFEMRKVDPGRYSREIAYRKFIAQIMIDIAPELVVNLDRNRGIQADDLVAEGCPAGAIAFELPNRGQNENLVRALNDPYTQLLSQNAGPEAFLEALGWDFAGPTQTPLETGSYVHVLQPAHEDALPNTGPRFKGRRGIPRILKKKTKG